MPKHLPSIKLTADDEHTLAELGYSILEPLNSGEYGIVYIAKRSKASPEKCAAKVIDLSKLNSEQIEKDLSREIFCMKRIKHPYVIEVFDMLRVAPNQLIVLMELGEGGDLCDLIAEKGWLEEHWASLYYRQFGAALSYIHSIGFAHRDMKLENILLNFDRTIAKLTDFGFACSLYDLVTGEKTIASTWCGTLAYMAPEILSQRFTYCPIKADVWSTGVLLFALLNDDFPWGDTDQKWMLEQQSARNYRIYNKSLSESARAVIDLHFEVQPENRPTLEVILQHSWFELT